MFRLSDHKVKQEWLVRTRGVESAITQDQQDEDNTRVLCVGVLSSIYTSSKLQLDLLTFTALYSTSKMKKNKYCTMNGLG